MRYTLIGVALAIAFRVGAVLSQGYHGAIHEAWIEYTFWWLLFTGIAIDYLRGCRWVRRARLWLCRRIPDARIFCPPTST